MDKDTPNPGSPDAARLGCKCPRMDNQHGRGYHWYEGQAEPQFIIHWDCPLHRDIFEKLSAVHEAEKIVNGQ